MKHPNLIDAANVMLTPAVSPSTLKAYAPVVKNFQDFCYTHKYSFPNFSEQNVLDFIDVTFNQKPL